MNHSMELTDEERQLAKDIEYGFFLTVKDDQDRDWYYYLMVPFENMEYFSHCMRENLDFDPYQVGRVLYRGEGTEPPDVIREYMKQYRQFDISIGMKIK